MLALVMALVFAGPVQAQSLRARSCTNQLRVFIGWHDQEDVDRLVCKKARNELDSEIKQWKETFDLEEYYQKKFRDEMLAYGPLEPKELIKYVWKHALKLKGQYIDERNLADELMIRILKFGPNGVLKYGLNPQELLKQVPDNPNSDPVRHRLARQKLKISEMYISRKDTEVNLQLMEAVSICFNHFKKKTRDKCLTIASPNQKQLSTN